MKVEIVKTSAAYPFGHLVQWTIQSTSPGPFVVTVERSGGPSGPWTKVLDAKPDQYAVLDKLDQTPESATFTRPAQLTLADVAYYRVTAVAPNGETAFHVEETGPQTADRKMSQYLRKLQRDFRLSIKFNGTPAAILKRPLWGERCPKCWDPATQTAVRSECGACMGTSFKGGYWAPYFTFARRSANNGSTSLSPRQSSDAAQLRYWTPDFPQLNKYDVIVAYKDSKIFVVEGQSQTEIQLAAVHQLVDVVELPHDHLLYRRKPALPNVRYPF